MRLRSLVLCTLMLATLATPMWAGGGPVTFPNDPVLGDLPPQVTVTIEFEVDVDDPLSTPATEVCNQATVTGSNFADVDTDDPTTVAVDDATCTGLRPFDFGDAPDPTYPTLAASSGAKHDIVAGFFLGDCVDGDSDGQPDATATGDDLGVGADVEGVCAVAGDDEDGVVFASMVPGVASSMTVVASAAGLVDAWVDFNGNGSWADLGEQVLDDQAVAAGPNVLPFSVPAGAAAGTSTFARVRFSSAGVAAPTGDAPDGEVEDYQVMIEQASIAVTKSALPTTVPEPGGNVDFTVSIENTGTVSANITSLVDDVHGDLNGQGTCSVPQLIGAGLTYMCTFTAAADCGDAGGVEIDTVTASGVAGGAPVSGNDSATVTCSDSLPSITVTKTAMPDSIAEPGGSIDFLVEVENTSASSDPVTLDTLGDDIYGDISMVQGDITATTCSLPQVIAPSNTYSCTFSVDYSCNAGDSQTDTVTASGTDDEANPVSGMDQATVSCTDAAPSLAVTKTPDPDDLEAPGGTVEFTVEVENTSVTSDTVTVDTLSDDIYGDITMVQGAIVATDCSVPQVITPGMTYSCAFTVAISCMAGDSETDTVTASGEDDEATPVMASGQATVTCSDGVPPTVTAIDTGAGTLEECETELLRVRDITLGFSEEMMGHDDPANYRLVTPGANGMFDTFECGGPPNDDGGETPFQIDTTADTATLRYLGLPDERYQLVACNELTDLAGNGLEGGVDDVDPDDDFQRSFRVDAFNLLINGNFDCDISGFAPFGAGVSTYDGGDDAQGSAESGSVELEMPAMPEDGLGVTSLCLAVTGDRDYEVAGQVQINSGVGNVNFRLACDFYAGDGGPCAGTLLATDVINNVGDTVGQWLEVATEVAAPSGAAFAQCSFSVNDVDPFEINLDRLFFGGESPIFSDGFETGDVSRWSGTSP